MNQLAAFPPMDEMRAARLTRRWRKAATERTSLLVGPALVDVVGRKPR
jgi:hypothetical protein